MRKIVLLILVLLVLAIPVSGVDIDVPVVPESGEPFMPEKTESFSEGLYYVFRNALSVLKPSVLETVKICITLIMTAMVTGLLISIDSSDNDGIELVGTVIAGVSLLQSCNTLIQLGTNSVQEISQYGKLLLPVLTSCLAAQGAVTQAGALYAGTAVFNAVLADGISKLLIPLLYIYLAITVSSNLFGQPMLKDIQKFVKWLMVWGLKIILYVFTGYISITGVVSGSTDATMLKATKLTISGMVPVVGSILSDASEAVLVSAGMMKNAAGIYGLLAILSLWIGPFMRMGVQYLMVKGTAGLCKTFGAKRTPELVKDISSVMGILVAMCGTVCLLHLISTICFMKGSS